MLSGGIANALTVSSGGTFNVQGQTSSGVLVAFGGTENVLSGGLISGAPNTGTFVSGGTLNVLSGGSGAYVLVELGGTLNLSAAVTNGGSTVDITLLGQYVTGNFHVASGTGGGTVVSDPPVLTQTDPQPGTLMNPHQA